MNSLNESRPPQIWYSCGCWTSRWDESPWGKPSPSSTYLPHCSLVLRKSFFVCNRNLLRAAPSLPLRQFMQQKAPQSDSVTGKVSLFYYYGAPSLPCISYFSESGEAKPQKVCRLGTGWPISLTLPTLRGSFTKTFLYWRADFVHTV